MKVVLSIDPNELVLAFRVALLIGAFTLITSTALLLVRWRRLSMQLDRKLRYLAVALFALHVVFQQISMISAPMYIPRFGTQFLAVGVALWGMLTPTHREYWKKRSYAELPYFEWPESDTSKKGEL